jgi:sortase A
VVALERVPLPVRLQIPSIGIDTLITSLGMTSSGAMDTPEDPNQVGWFDLGPRPGEVGSAVIAGHREWNRGATAVFDNLSKLKPGDSIFILTGTGMSLTFVVKESQLFSRDANAKPIFTSLSGTHLNLITCDGIWDRSEKSYSERLVVFADKVPDGVGTE